MSYWWVNQNQPFKQETEGGYLWSPKLKANQARNPFYEFMRMVKPGDVVFSFADTEIKAVGIAASTAYGFPKPEEFGVTGANWSVYGWKVDVGYHLLANPIKPSAFIDELRPYLPNRYSPLQATGRGNQGVYLTTLSDELAELLLSRIGAEGERYKNIEQRLRDPVAEFLEIEIDGIAKLEERLIHSFSSDLSDTQRESIVLARRGQGIFRKNVAALERRCRVTEVENPLHLVASHIKPWRYCASVEERLVGSNGLMLTPSVDHLFDKGFVSFEDTGELIVSPLADSEALVRMGVVEGRCLAKAFNIDQKSFMKYHRSDVFLKPDAR
jgi:putative restriction endonuclease